MWSITPSSVRVLLILEPKKFFVVGTVGSPELGISCMFLLKDLTTLAVGTKKGVILIY